MVTEVCWLSCDEMTSPSRYTVIFTDIPAGGVTLSVNCPKSVSPIEWLALFTPGSLDVLADPSSDIKVHLPNADDEIWSILIVACTAPCAEKDQKPATIEIKPKTMSLDFMITSKQSLFPHTSKRVLHFYWNKFENIIPLRELVPIKM